MELKFPLMVLLAILMITAGVAHFRKPGIFVKIVPPYLPSPLALVYISGFFEILGGVGLLIPYTSKIAAWGLVALFLAVFPANIHMAVNRIPFAPGQPPLFAWIRLPFQILLIAWAWWFT